VVGHGRGWRVGASLQMVDLLTKVLHLVGQFRDNILNAVHVGLRLS